MKTENNPDFIPCHLVCSVVNGPLSENSPARRDSEISKLGMGLMGVIGVMGLMGRKHIIKNSPAQRDSKDNMRGDLPPVVYNIWSAQSTKY